MMEKIKPREFKLKNNKTVIVRRAELQDAEKLLKHVELIFTDDSFFLTTAAEAQKWMNIEKTTERIQKHNDKGKLLLLAEVDGILAGTTDISHGEKKRIRHIGELGISILKEYRGIGIGRALIQTAIDWAQQDPTIEKIGLGVHDTNTAAIGLYEKLGFSEEGRRIKEIKTAPNEYNDIVMMYRLVN